MTAPPTRNPPNWARYEPLLLECTHAELVSAVLLDDSGTHNVFSVLTFTRQPEAPSPSRFEFITSKPRIVPGSAAHLAIGRSTVSAAVGETVLPTGERFVEPVNGKAVHCEGRWADPVFVGQEVHRLRTLVPEVDRQYWVFQYVPPQGAIEKLVGPRGLEWLNDEIASHLRRSIAARSDYIGGFLVVLPEYRGAIRVERGEEGRIGVEFQGERDKICPIVHARVSRNDELVSAEVVQAESRFTVLDGGRSDFEEVELYDLKSGLLLDRHAGHPIRAFGLSMHVGESVEFDVTLHDEAGTPSGDPLHVKTNWGRIQESGIDDHAEWEKTQRQAAILAEQKRLHRDGRLFFYSGVAGERQKAINDIRGLIRTHTKNELCVWDPYFGGRDAVEFLPHVADPAIRVRVLTSLASPSCISALVESQLKEALKALNQQRGRGPGMTNIEVRRGNHFHDRFLLTDVSCWQLGTSFNQIGGVYSTIVEFPYADLVRQAFDREWKCGTVVASS